MYRMQEDLPYSTLRQDERAYEIMLLRDQHENTYADIAKEYGITTTRVVQIYTRTKHKQMRLYIDHLAEILGDKGNIEKIYGDAYECYQDLTYSCAYLEKKYKAILDEYRAGEPGMPTQFIGNMPPFKPELSETEVDRIIEMREVEKASFKKIADDMNLTQAKAKHSYDSFYHKQVVALVSALQEKATSYEERVAIWEYYYKKYRTPKDRYDALTKG